jgi:hypothetical protein
LKILFLVNPLALAWCFLARRTALTEEVENLKASHTLCGVWSGGGGYLRRWKRIRDERFLRV